LPSAVRRALGEDVEDQRGPVDDLDAERLGDVALLDRRELVVGNDEVGDAAGAAAPISSTLPRPK
jgi:hypothetical protein